MRLSRDIFTNTRLGNGRVFIDSHSVNVNIKYLIENLQTFS